MSFRNLLIGAIGLLSISNLIAQNGPGLISGKQSWLTGNDSTTIIANRWTIDLLDSNFVLEPRLAKLNSEYTIFIVAHPDSLGIDPNVFAQLGSFQLRNDGVMLSGRLRPIDFSDGLSKVIAVSAYKRSQIFQAPFKGAYELKNDKMFDLAELIIYDRVLDSNEIRLVSSYLAFKHSVPLARGNQQFPFFLKGYGGKYWNESVSRIYNHDFLAVGHSMDELLYQSQSSTQNDSLTIGLDSILQAGQLPNVGISDQAFIVFSQAKKQYRKYIKCQGSQTPDNPIYYWKFELQEWHSNAQYLKVKVKGPFFQNDTISLLSTGFQLNLPSLLTADSSRLYSIPIYDLPNNQHFFFKPIQKDTCPELIDIQNLDSLGTLSLKADPDSIDQFEIINLDNGSIIAMENLNLNEIQLLDGNYLLVGSRNNEVVYSEPLQSQSNQDPNTSSSLSISQVDIYPKPALKNSTITLEAQNLSQSMAIISMTDMNGRELYRQSFDITDQYLKVQIPSPAVSGIFKVSLQQDHKTFSSLVPVNN